MAQRVILHHKEMGIYLGSCLGFGFWSKLDPAGQDAAWTFESVKQAQEAIASWDSPIENPMFTHVEAEGQFATIQQCVNAGLDAWEPDRVPAVRTLEGWKLPVRIRTLTNAKGLKSTGEYVEP